MSRGWAQFRLHFHIPQTHIMFAIFFSLSIEDFRSHSSPRPLYCPNPTQPIQLKPTQTTLITSTTNSNKLRPTDPTQPNSINLTYSIKVHITDTNQSTQLINPPNPIQSNRFVPTQTNLNLTHPIETNSI